VPSYFHTNGGQILSGLIEMLIRFVRPSKAYTVRIHCNNLHLRDTNNFQDRKLSLKQEKMSDGVIFSYKRWTNLIRVDKNLDKIGSSNRKLTWCIRKIGGIKERENAQMVPVRRLKLTEINNNEM
jgi:hypothetical protein